MHTEAGRLGRARLLSGATSESGAWLHAMPAASRGTNLDQEALRITMALTVGADVCSEHRYRIMYVRSASRPKGDHSLTCRFSA